MRLARAAVLEEYGRLVPRSFPVPDPGPEEALLRVELAGVCGTDPKVFHGRLRQAALPIILGHEILGRIEAIGEVAAERAGVGVGDRVTVEASVGCGVCVRCRRGASRFCRDVIDYGVRISAARPPHLLGAFAEYLFLLPHTSMHKIPEDLPARGAVMLNAVLSNGIQWVKLRGGARPGDAVLIQGAGQQALACTIAAKECGAAPIIVSGLRRDAERLALAREFGADATVIAEEENLAGIVADLTHGEGADLVVDVTGDPAAIAAALHLLRPQGTLVHAGVTGDSVLTQLPLDVVLFKELRIQGVFSKGSEAVLAAIDLLASRRYAVERMISRVYPLAQAETAVRAAGNELPDFYPIKVAVDPWL